MFPRIHPFALDNWSSRGNVYFRHESLNFVSSVSSSVTKYCPLATVLRNPHRSTVWSIEFRLDDLRIFVRILAASLFAPAQWSEVVWSLSTNLLIQSLSRICSQLQVFLCFLNSPKSSRSVRHVYPLLLRDTELIDGNDRTKNHFDCVCIITDVYRQFFTSFPRKDPRSKVLGPWIATCPLSLKLILMSSATWSHSPYYLYVWVPHQFFSDPGPRKDKCPCANLLAYPVMILAFAIHNSLFPYSLHTMSSYIDLKMIRPMNCSGSHCISVIIFWISTRICNVVNPWKSWTRTPSTPRRFDPILDIGMNL